MLSKQSFFFCCNNISLVLFFGLLLSTLLPFLFSLCAINSKFLLPELLDITLMLQLSHASLLGIHLLKTLILGEFLSHFNFEVLFHSSFFSQTLSLKFELIILSGLELLKLTQAFCLLISLSLTGTLLNFFDLKLVSEVLLIFLLSPTLSLLKCKLLEDGLTLLLSFFFKSLKVIGSLLLLTSVSSDQLLFILIKLLLTFLKSFFLIK